ncbi:MAG: hypothetical protein J7L73_09405 [Anaerolineales bacterium]|nr:hypothetical protein [Anaerolineales bacterium]
MKRMMFFLSILVFLSLACNLSGLTSGQETPSQQSAPTIQSEHRCGDGVCDGPENAKNCPQDCTQANSTTEETQTNVSSPSGNKPVSSSHSYNILYQVTENTVINNQNCYSFTFSRFLDGGIIQPDGNNNRNLPVKDYPTSKITAKKNDNYFYVSTPSNPLAEKFGFLTFNWDVDGQTLWQVDFANNNPVTLVKSENEKFPGDATTAPENKFLIYPLTNKAAKTTGNANGINLGKFDPFTSDSSLVIANLSNGKSTTVLANHYNRDLFVSFSDFSPDGAAFYTLAKDGNDFKFVKVSLENATVTDFPTLFPNFNWDSINWDDFFPPANDFAYGEFTISPDESRLIAYKNIYTPDMQHTCIVSASHNLWVFDLKNNKTQVYRNQAGYVSSASWKADSSAFALALIGNAGCYPDYLDAKIELYDKDGKSSGSLVSEPKSKITTISWSPVDDVIAYDVYSTDFVGRLKLVDVQTKNVQELINTQELGYAVTKTKPVVILFADWVAIEK